MGDGVAVSIDLPALGRRLRRVRLEPMARVSSAIALSATPRSSKSNARRL